MHGCELPRGHGHRLGPAENTGDHVSLQTHGHSTDFGNRQSGNQAQRQSSESAIGHRDRHGDHRSRSRLRNAGAAGRDPREMEEFENRTDLETQRRVSEPPSRQRARDERARDHELPDRSRVEGQEPTQEGK